MNIAVLHSLPPLPKEWISRGEGGVCISLSATCAVKILFCFLEDCDCVFLFLGTRPVLEDHILGVSDDSATLVREIRTLEIILGREPTCDIIIDGTRVSKDDFYVQGSLIRR